MEGRCDGEPKCSPNFAERDCVLSLGSGSEAQGNGTFLEASTLKNPLGVRPYARSDPFFIFDLQIRQILTLVNITGLTSEPVTGW